MANHPDRREETTKVNLAEISKNASKRGIAAKPYPMAVKCDRSAGSISREEVTFLRQTGRTWTRIIEDE